MDNRNVKPQILEIVPQQHFQEDGSTVPPMKLLHYLNGEPSEASPESVPQQLPRTEYELQDIQSPFALMPSLHQYDGVLPKPKSCTIIWQPTSPMEGQKFIPPGEKWEITPDGQIVHTDLAPLTKKQSHLPSTSNVAQWRDSVESGSTMHPIIAATKAAVEVYRAHGIGDNVRTASGHSVDAMAAAAAAAVMEASKRSKPTPKDVAPVPASEPRPVASTSEPIDPAAAVVSVPALAKEAIIVPVSEPHPASTDTSGSTDPVAAAPALVSPKSKKRAREEDSEGESANPRPQAPNPPLSSESQPHPELEPPRPRRSSRRAGAAAGKATKENGIDVAGPAAATRAKPGARAKSSRSSKKSKN